MGVWLVDDRDCKLVLLNAGCEVTDEVSTRIYKVLSKSLTNLGTSYDFVIEIFRWLSIWS